MYREDCPVCSAQMKISTDTIDVGFGSNGPICEEYRTCPNGCYSYEFAYGATRVFVTVNGLHMEFGWQYDDSTETLRANTAAIDSAIESARRIKHREDQAQRPEEPRQSHLDN